MTAEEDPHEALAAYVLHALPPAEEAAFETHLAGCATCRAELPALREVVAELATAVSTPVPEHLRAATLEAITRVEQEGAVRPTRTGGRRKPALLLAASIVAAALLAGTTAWQYTEAEHARTQAAQARSSSQALTDLLVAPDVTVHTAELADGARGAVAVSRGGRKAVFAAQGLPAPGSGRTYELWYAYGSGDLRPAGLVPGDARHAAHVLDGPPDDAVAVGITLEPASGSKQPTTKPLGIIPITS
ncbi:anti-sigma factor [Streptomyces longwoodensis]|uniref:anti-sigma factor n=1 Tax=Streptomyces longwoodensis TaxID=68231 RepID=UPI0033C4C452